MNKNRRKQLQQIAVAIKSIIDTLDYIKSEEDDSRSNIPENLENSELYEKSEECSDILDDAISSLNEIMENILTIT